MDDPSPVSPPPDPAPEAAGRLDSWKEIAAYLKRDVTTVQRWEKRERMPVHRHLHDKLGSVYAFRAELDAWARARTAGPDPAAGALPAPGGSSRVWRRGALIAAAVAVVVLVAIGAYRLLPGADEQTSPIAEARFQYVTDFGGTEHAAAISRDGRFVAFLSDRGGRADVWVTQVGTGQFHDLTRGAFAELVNPSVRTLGFSPDGALVTFWTRRTGSSGSAEIGVWAVPTLGGQPRPYLEGAAEFDWSSDGSQLVYHTPGPGDPTFVKRPGEPAGRLILTAPPGLHAHFPRWSPDQSFVYLVQGTVPDAMDVWRVRPGGGTAERVTRHGTRVSHPVLLDRRTLAYLASDADGSGPWLHTMDVESRVARRVSAGVDRYTSLAASADGRRLVATVARPKRTLWRLALSGAPAAAPRPIALTTGNGASPRLGPGSVVYVSSRGTSDSVWKVADDGTTTELWSAPAARIIGGPELDATGRRVAFAAVVDGRPALHVVDADGRGAKVLADSLDVRGAPAWAPDGASITAAALAGGAQHLVRVALDGGVQAMTGDYAIDPVWSPDGRFVIYSGPDVGTTFRLAAITPAGAPHALPDVTLTRGARRVRFVGRRSIVVLRGDIEHKDLWRLDLEDGSEEQLTRLPPDFNLRDFDISADGREAVLERIQDRSDIVMLETRPR